MIGFTSAYDVRLALSMAQFLYTIFLFIIFWFGTRTVEMLGIRDYIPNKILLVADEPEKSEARNPFFYARNESQPHQRSFRKDAVQSAAHLFEEADQLHRSQSTTLKWKHV
jgi:hypothetical protein